MMINTGWNEDKKKDEYLLKRGETIAKYFKALNSGNDKRGTADFSE